MPINEQFPENVNFLTFPAYRMRKKGSENRKTKGGTLEVFCDFGHFRDLIVLLRFCQSKIFLVGKP